MDNEILYSIWLSLAGGYANSFAWDSYTKYGGSENACRELFMSGGNSSAAPQKVRMRAEKYPFSEARKIYDTVLRSGIKIITRFDADYPEELEKIEDPPFLLYYRGDLGELSSGRPMIAMVGARYSTDYSVRVASSLSRDLSKCGFGIVSGFAVGTDIAAHLAACAAGGYTCAVIGCGLNYSYPKENYPYAKLIAEHGAVISEYPPDQPPRAQSFPVRNRILAGLAFCTIVVEAGAKSGSLVTVDHTERQGKTTFVVPPGDIFNKAFSGNVHLLREGAPLIMSARDIVNEYFPVYEHKLTPTAAVMYSDAGASMPLSECEKKAASSSDIVPVSEEASEALKKIISQKGGGKVRERKNRKGSSGDLKKAIPPDSKYYKSVYEKVREFADGIDNIPSETSVPSWEGKLTEDQQRCADVLKASDRPLTADDIAEELGSSASDILLLLTEMELDGIITGGAGKTYTLNS